MPYNLDELRKVIAAFGLNVELFVETTYTADNFLWGSGDPVTEIAPVTPSMSTPAT